jgi:hypothetical protein
LFNLNACAGAGCSKTDFIVTLAAQGDIPEQSLALDAGCAGVYKCETTKNFDVLVAGNSELYPNDQYTFEADFGFHGKSIDVEQHTTVSAMSGHIGADSEVKFDDPFLVGSLVGYTEPTTEEGLRITGSLKRTVPTQAYVWSIASVPLLFALLFLHMLFINRSSRQVPLLDFMVALSATSLAVLPLRAVLVPAEIGGLTRVDTLLGVGIASLVTLGLVRYARDLWRRPKQ